MFISLCYKSKYFEFILIFLLFSFLIENLVYISRGIKILSILEIHIETKVQTLHFRFAVKFYKYKH